MLPTNWIRVWEKQREKKRKKILLQGSIPTSLGCGAKTFPLCYTRQRNQWCNFLLSTTKTSQGSSWIMLRNQYRRPQLQDSQNSCMVDRNFTCYTVYIRLIVISQRQWSLICIVTWPTYWRQTLQNRCANANDLGLKYWLQDNVCFSPAMYFWSWIHYFFYVSVLYFFLFILFNFVCVYIGEFHLQSSCFSVITMHVNRCPLQTIRKWLSWKEMHNLVIKYVY